jgi:translation initiation factor 1 (eIF-1/SUI1)
LKDGVIEIQGDHVELLLGRADQARFQGEEVRRLQPLSNRLDPA